MNRFLKTIGLLLCGGLFTATGWAALPESWIKWDTMENEAPTSYRFIGGVEPSGWKVKAGGASRTNGVLTSNTSGVAPFIDTNAASTDFFGYDTAPKTFVMTINLSKTDAIADANTIRPLMTFASWQQAGGFALTVDAVTENSITFGAAKSTTTTFSSPMKSAKTVSVDYVAGSDLTIALFFSSEGVKLYTRTNAEDKMELTGEWCDEEGAPGAYKFANLYANRITFGSATPSDSNCALFNFSIKNLAIYPNVDSTTPLDFFSSDLKFAVNSATVGINFSRNDDNAKLSTSSDELYGYQSEDGMQGGFLAERSWQSFYASNDSNPFVNGQAYSINVSGNPMLNVTLTKESSNSIWGPNTNKIFGSYLDNASKLTFNGLPMSGYDVAIIFAGDGNSGRFSHVKVNGVSKTYNANGALINGTSSWGSRTNATSSNLKRVDATGTATTGQVMYLANMNASTLTLETVNDSNNVNIGRGTIAAIMFFLKEGKFEKSELSGSEPWTFEDVDDVDAKTIQVTEKSSPSSITVDNTNTDYSIVGAEISGSASLTKKGTGSLYMGGANSFTGGVTIEGGTFVESGYYTSSSKDNKMGSGKASGDWASKITLKNGIFDLNHSLNYRNGGGGVWGWLSTQTLTLGGIANGTMEIKNGVFGIGIDSALTYDATNNPGTATISAHYVFTGTSNDALRTFNIGDSTATDTEVNFTGGLHANKNVDGQKTTIEKSSNGTMQISCQYGFKGLKLSAGKVRMGYADAFLSGNQGNFDTLIFNDGELDLAGFNQQVPKMVIDKDSALTSTGAAAKLTTGSLEGANTVKLGSDVTLAYAGGSQAFAGKFSSEGTLSAGILEVVSGTLTLTGKDHNHKVTNVSSGATLILQIATSDEPLNDWTNKSFTDTNTTGHVIDVAKGATLELKSGHAYVQMRGEGTTQVSGVYNLGFGGGSTNAIQTATLKVTENATLQCRSWDAPRAITSENLIVDGVIIENGGNNSVSCTSVKNLSGAGTISVPVTLKDQAVIDATTTVKGENTLTISKLTLPASGIVTVKVAALSEESMPIMKCTQAPMNLDSISLKVDNNGVLYEDAYSLTYADGILSLVKGAGDVAIKTVKVSMTVAEDGSRSATWKNVVGDVVIAEGATLEIDFGDAEGSAVPGSFTFDNETTLSFSTITVKGSNGGSIYRAVNSGAISATDKTKIETNVTVYEGALPNGAIEIAANQTLALEDGEHSAYTGQIIVNSGAILNFTYGAGLTNAASSIQCENGAKLYLQNGAGGTSTVASAITLTGTVTFRGSIYGNATQLTGAITGTGALIIEKDPGASNPITFSGENTYSGGTEIKQGATLKICSANSLPLSGNIALAGTLEYAGPASATMEFGGTLSSPNTNSLGDLKVTSGILKMTTANDFKGKVTIGTGATLDIATEGAKLFSSSHLRDEKLVVQGTLKTRNWVYNGSLGALGHNTTHVKLDGGRVEFVGKEITDVNSDNGNTRGFVVTQNGATLCLEDGATYSKNKNKDAQIRLNGPLTLTGAGSYEFCEKFVKSDTASDIRNRSIIVENGSTIILGDSDGSLSSTEPIFDETLTLKAGAAVKAGAVADSVNHVAALTLANGAIIDATNGAVKVTEDINPTGSITVKGNNGATFLTYTGSLITNAGEVFIPETEELYAAAVANGDTVTLTLVTPPSITIEGDAEVSQALKQALANGVAKGEVDGGKTVTAVSNANILEVISGDVGVDLKSNGEEEKPTYIATFTYEFGVSDITVVAEDTKYYVEATAELGEDLWFVDDVSVILVDNAGDPIADQEVVEDTVSSNVMRKIRFPLPTTLDTFKIKAKATNESVVIPQTPTPDVGEGGTGDAGGDEPSNEGDSTGNEEPENQ